MTKEEFEKHINHIRFGYPMDNDQSEDYHEGFDDGIEWAIEQFMELLE